MDKICIVKRRKKDGDPVFSGFDNCELAAERETDTEVPLFKVTDVRFSAEKEIVTGHDFSGERRFSLELTPAQTASLHSADWLTYLAGVRRESATFSAVAEEKKIVLNFHFKTIPQVFMLSGKDVGRMLSVSHSFIRRLARSGAMKSYKMGKLRRFLLNDVLEYLSETALASGPDKEKGR